MRCRGGEFFLHRRTMCCPPKEFPFQRKGFWRKGGAFRNVLFFGKAEKIFPCQPSKSEKKEGVHLKSFCHEVEYRGDMLAWI
jgi:hypothetical protein